MSINAVSPSLHDHRLAALVSSLRACPLFDALPHADLETIAEGCQMRSLQKGEILFHEGEPAEGFYVIQLGQIGIFFITPEGREQIFSVFRAPESFAEVVMAMRHFPAGAKALEYSRVILVRRAPFRELLGRKPELALQMLASMSMHLKELLRLLQDSRGRQIEARLAEWLLQQSPAAAAGCPAVFELPVAKKVLASQLGVTSETLSRTFARFREEKVIQVTGATIGVLNGARLRAYAAGTA
ncbi:Crp/Fnr family transcriptional regulator [Opitutus terrae]|uniref:Transcriptional regulator, Crp/Fnr family n=1 Tax=Opitutus terrae (strain DSM 11246 / JCM 15787 / PB90-1) TaxID=452637 RepID=B1ZX96_OPITP|nr:Crp/Fnr family transcriptional regulator [Opitutus terrae]ACB76148.1 transcriptional regulator, Crp/Fnr family [Opitutus terrae PB90-1]